MLVRVVGQFIRLMKLRRLMRLRREARVVK